VKLVYWGKYIDTYLAETLQRYEEATRMPVQYIVVEGEFTRRKVAGAQAVKHPDQLKVLDKRKRQQQADRVLAANQDAVHLFLSFWGDKRLFGVLLKALHRGRNVAVVFEPYASVPLGYWKDEARILSHFKILSRHIAYRFLWPLIKRAARGPLPCVLAVSPLAQEQLRKVGFPEEVIFPFGYFTERKNGIPVQRKQAEVLRALFSGTLIRRKGLDIAIAAVRRVNSPTVKVQLDIYGAGEVKKFLAHSEPGISYKGVYLQEQAQRVISAYDLMLVPSRHEGWGLVVNEALMQSVPVCASDRVGAKCLLETSGAGLTFRSGDAAHLAALLAHLAADRHALQVMAQNCNRIANLITPSAGAEYLREVIQFYFAASGRKPKAFWLNASPENPSPDMFSHRGKSGR